MVTHSSRKDTECKLCGASFGPKAHSSGITGGTQVSRPQPLLPLTGARLLGFVAPDSWRCEAGADTALSADSAPISVPSVGRASGSRGALTRHLKSLTPCTEKIRFSMSKDVVVGKGRARRSA